MKFNFRSEYMSIAIVAVLLLLLMWVESQRPEKVDWTPSYEIEQKTPYACWILFEHLNDIFPKETVHTSHLPAYDTSIKAVRTYNNESETKANYILINNYFNVSEYDVDEMLAFVENGNTIFIATDYLPSQLSKRLKLDFKLFSYPFLTGSKKEEELITQYIKHPNKEYHLNYVLPKRVSQRCIDVYNDSIPLDILGYNNNNCQPNFIRVRYGEGNIYLCSNPLSMSNYAMLTENGSAYTAHLLSFLPQQHIIWDEYYTVGDTSTSGSDLRYFLGEPALKSFIYLFIVMLLLIVLFETKRRQRIIPLIPPVKNSTLAFIKTIGNLYWQKGNHKDLVNKKIKYFNNEIKQRYFLERSRYNQQEFTHLLAVKSGVAVANIKDLLVYMEELKQQKKIYNWQLIAISQKLDAFYEKAR